MSLMQSSQDELLERPASTGHWELKEQGVRRLFILPATVVILVLAIFPLLFSLAITFTNLRLLGGGSTRFIGIENWVRLLADGDFRIVLMNTLVLVIGGVTVQYLLGLGLALLLNQEIVGRRFFRISLLLPMMMSPVAVSYVLGDMMMSETYGPLNDWLMRLGLPPFRWTLSATNSMLVLIGIDTWQWTPLFILVLLAALQSIPQELYDAARVDGATGWNAFRYITLPMLIPVSATVILLRALEAFKVIDIVRVVTGGGPGNSTESVTLYAYDIGLKGGDIAYASTVAYGLMIVVILFSIVFLQAVRRVTPDR